MSGQSITDRIAAAQHSMTGSAISKALCKATTHEVSGPKKKHLDCEYAKKIKSPCICACTVSSQVFLGAFLKAQSVTASLACSSTSLGLHILSCLDTSDELEHARDGNADLSSDAVSSRS
ncbi:hypothetical protein PO909_024261 [Leuciscus waleckii]